MASSFYLASNWTFKQGGLTSENNYLAANNVPTEVHRDLLKNGKIQDPFTNLNELSVRWIGDEIWTYKTTFKAPPDYGEPGVVTILLFEGLDTFASVHLNGQLVLESDNMFVAHQINITGRLQGGGNTLEIVFESARKVGLELVKQHQEHRFIVHQTEVSRGPVRKAQYQWGWDWGPILLTCGPWKPIMLKTIKSELSELSVQYKLAPDLKSADMTTKVFCRGPITGVDFTVVNTSTGVVVASKHIDLQETHEDVVSVEANLQIDGIELWWPRGYGSQELYKIQADATALQTLADTCSKTFGFRKVELIQEPDTYDGKEATSFYFRINNVDIFIGGSCWIPADSLLTQITPNAYKSWVELAAKGNQSMLRVWGGGIYEADAFYEAADELGVLIWQDFAFACANYPTYSEYLQSVEKEATQNVRRLHHHPSLVIWAGNNEDYQIPERYNIPYDRDEKDPQKWLESEFPARYIYEYLLPKIISQESPGIPYHPSSPYGNGKSTTLVVDPTVGDIHQWNVWHGTMEPYQKLDTMGGRFVSEFGMEAYPHIATLKKCITRDKDRHPGSMAMDFRNKAIGHERRLVSYVAENFRLRYDLASFTHLSQIMQADAISWAYKAWRRQWGSTGNRRCGGVLVWQLNDCWPTISWAIVDYYRVPKPAYYAIKRVMEPVTIGVQRKYRSWTMRPADELWHRDTGHIDMRELWRNAEFDVWVANGTIEVLKATVVIECFSIRTGARLFEDTIGPEVGIMPNGSTNIFQNRVLVKDDSQGPNEPFDFSKTDPFVVQVALTVGDTDTWLAKDTAWPDPIKYLSFEDRGVEVRYSDDGTLATISTTKPVKGFCFSEKAGIGLSDNGFDIMPGRAKDVTVTGCKADELSWTYVGL